MTNNADDHISLRAIGVVDSLINKNYDILKQAIGADIDIIKPLLDNLKSKNAAKVTKRLLQNDIITDLPDKYAVTVMEQLTSEDPSVLEDILLITRKLIQNNFDKKREINYISPAHIERIMDLTNHGNENISITSTNIIKELLDKTDLIPVENIKDTFVTGILENLDRKDSNILSNSMPISNILSNSMSILRILVQKGKIKNKDEFITDDHIKRILELADYESEDRVSISALKLIDMLLKAEFEKMKNSIDSETAEKLIRKSNSDDSDVTRIKQNLKCTLKREGLLTPTVTTIHPLFRNQIDSTW